MAAVHAGLRIESMSEHAVDQNWQRHAACGQISGWPLLLLMRLKPGHWKARSSYMRPHLRQVFRIDSTRPSHLLHHGNRRRTRKKKRFAIFSDRFSRQYVSGREICRRAGGKWRFREDLSGDADFNRNVEKGFLDADASGHSVS